MTQPTSSIGDNVARELQVCGLALRICWYFAAVFLVLGVVGEVTGRNIGLAPDSWFLLLVAAFLAGIIFKLGWVMAWYATVSK